MDFTNEEISEIEALKNKLGVECKCNDENCGKCLIINCKDDNCPVHTLELKKERQQIKAKGTDLF